MSLEPCLLTSVPLEHLASAKEAFTDDQFVVFGSEAAETMLKFLELVRAGKARHVFIYPSHASAIGGPQAHYSATFEDFGGRDRLRKGWAEQRPPSTIATDSTWNGYYAISGLSKLDQPLPMTFFKKRNGGASLANDFVPHGPIIVDADLPPSNQT